MDGPGDPDHGSRRGPEVVEKFQKKYGAGEIAKYYSKLDVAVRVPLA